MTYNGSVVPSTTATIQTPLHHHMNIVESDKGGNQIAISKISVRALPSPKLQPAGPREAAGVKD